jgi:hypothetical protein
MVYLHYARAPLRGPFLVPWRDLSEELRGRAGHAGACHEKRPELAQYRDDVVYFHDIPDHLADLKTLGNLGLGYARKAWIYEVEPIGPIEDDPERGHPYGSRVAPRAQIIRCLSEGAPSTCSG